MVKRVQVGPHHFALIDDEDADLVGKVSWCLVQSCRTFYAHTTSRKIGRFRRLLHRLVMRAEPGEIVDHINGDGLDNRRQNLRIVSAKENANNRFFYDRRDPHDDPSIEEIWTPVKAGQSDPLRPLRLSTKQRHARWLRGAKTRAKELAQRAAARGAAA